MNSSVLSNWRSSTWIKLLMYGLFAILRRFGYLELLSTILKFHDNMHATVRVDVLCLNVPNEMWHNPRVRTYFPFFQIRSLLMNRFGNSCVLIHCRNCEKNYFNFSDPCTKSKVRWLFIRDMLYASVSQTGIREAFKVIRGRPLVFSQGSISYPQSWISVTSGAPKVSRAREQSQFGRPHPARLWQHRCEEWLGGKGASKADSALPYKCF